MKSVLHGFLGTFTSRYSDHQGYWLLGQLHFDVAPWTVDLLARSSEGASLHEITCDLARRRFGEQVAKSGLPVDVVREATLRLVRDPQPVEGWQGDHRVQGWMFNVSTRVVMDNGRVFEKQQAVFVAPHDPSKERRRNPVDWGT